MKKNLHIVIIAIVFSSILWISITLSEEYYSTYKIPINIINAPSGYTLASDLSENISVKIKGIGWRLTGINLGSETVYNISARNDSGKIITNVYSNLIENPWLSSDLEVIEISPDTISFMIERIISKKLPVVTKTDITFKAGFGLASKIKIAPDSVVVYGPKSRIEKMDSIKTNTIVLSLLDNYTKVNADFVNGLYKTDIAGVEVRLDVQRIVDKNIDDIKVEVIDVPKDRDVVLLPNTISCLVKGGINVLGKITAQDFKAFVYYHDVLLDTLGSVGPTIEHPENVELLSRKPDRIRYIIKKFK